MNLPRFVIRTIAHVAEREAVTDLVQDQVHQRRNLACLRDTMFRSMNQPAFDWQISPRSNHPLDFVHRTTLELGGLLDQPGVGQKRPQPYYPAGRCRTPHPLIRDDWGVIRRPAPGRLRRSSGRVSRPENVRAPLVLMAEKWTVLT